MPREVIEKIEQNLSELRKEDDRLFRIWAEYYVALQIMKKCHQWRIVVHPDQKTDVACYTNGEEEKKIIVEVKTGKMGEWSNRDDLKREKDYVSKPIVLHSADATFSKYQVENEKSFQYAVFIVHNNYEMIRAFVFSRDQLSEILDKNSGRREGNRASYFYLTCAESFEELKEWNRYYKNKIFKIEGLLTQNPQLFMNKWEAIR